MEKILFSKSDYVRMILIVFVLGVALFLGTSCTSKSGHRAEQRQMQLDSIAAASKAKTVKVFPTVQMFRVDVTIVGKADTTVYVVAKDKYDADRIVDNVCVLGNDTMAVTKSFSVVEPIRAKPIQ